MDPRRPFTPAPTKGPLEVEHLGLIIDPSYNLGGVTLDGSPSSPTSAPDLSMNGRLSPPAGAPAPHIRIPFSWSDPGYTDGIHYGGRALFGSPLAAVQGESTAFPHRFRDDWRRPKLISPADQEP